MKIPICFYHVNEDAVLNNQYVVCVFALGTHFCSEG